MKPNKEGGICYIAVIVFCDEKTIAFLSQTMIAKKNDVCYTRNFVQKDWIFPFSFTSHLNILIHNIKMFMQFTHQREEDDAMKFNTSRLY